MMPSRQHVVFLIPGSLDSRTGGYEYDRRIIDGLRDRGWSVDVRALKGGFPRPTPETLEDAAHILALIPDGATVLVDGLAFGAMPDEVYREASRLKFVALVHMPLATEVGLDPATALRVEAGEQRALSVAALVVVTGASALRTLADYGVGSERVVVIEPGTARAPLARGSGDRKLELLSVAALTPGKGHDVLFRALAMVPFRRWHLTCAGSLERDPVTVDRLRGQLQVAELEDRVSLVGELDDAALAAKYDAADVFVLATLKETYGMAVAEALARGLPVVSTTTGAIPDLVNLANPANLANPLNLANPGNLGNPGKCAGLLVPPGDVRALAACLTRVLSDARLRAALRSAAAAVRDRLPTWTNASSKMAAALRRVAER